MNKKIGIIGLGAIGYPIAQRLRSVNFELYTVVRSEKTRNLAIDMKVCVLESFSDLSKYVDIVILLVSNYEQCKLCLEGILQTMKTGVIILGSTVSPTEAKMLANMCPKTVSLLDAPISGGVSKAQKGELVTMIAGCRELCDSVSNIISCYSSKMVYVGDKIGDAQQIKILNQMLVGINIVATAEVISLARKKEVDLKSMYEVISLCAGNSFIFQNRAPKIINEDFSMNASVQTLEKDTGIALKLAKEEGVNCYLTSICNTLYKKMLEESDKIEDACSVVRMYENDV